jgi:hypothetical protein
VVADRYRLLERVGSEHGAERYRARDQRLHRDVLVEVGRSAEGIDVRAMAGADDTGMHAVLDGGVAEGRTFVVREMAGSAYDETAPIHLGESTAVMAVPGWHEVPSVPATPAPAPPPPRRRRSARTPLLWLAGAAAAALLAVALVAWAGGRDPDPTEGPGTTVGTAGEVEATSDSPRTPSGSATTVAPTTTEAPATTVAPEATETTLGFPFDDGGELPPGQEQAGDPEPSAG